MFNSQPDEKRVIQLKTVKPPIKDQESPDLTAEVTLQLDKLEQARLELEETKQKREALLLDAEKQIQSMRDNWEQEKQALMEQTKEEGFQAGFTEGKEQSVTQYQQLLEEANRITLLAKQDYEATIEKSEESILTLALHISEKIMKQKLTEQPDTFLPIVIDAIQAIKDQRTISILLHPDNYPYILEHKTELERVLDSKAELTILVNESLTKDSCIIEHPFGKIDASLDTQLSEIKNVLHELVLEKKQ